MIREDVTFESVKKNAKTFLQIQNEIDLLAIASEKNANIRYLPKEHCEKKYVSLVEVEKLQTTLQEEVKKRPRIKVHFVPQKEDDSYDWQTLSIKQEKKLLRFEAWACHLEHLLGGCVEAKK